MKIILILFSSILLVSCAKIYSTSDAVSLAHSHKKIAVLPPVISIAASKKIDAESIKEQQKTESLNFQKEIFSWFLKRKSQGKFNPEILDVETTNSKLKKFGYPDSVFTPVEMVRKLNVDGVIVSSFALSKPMSEGGAIALNILTGGYAATNEVRGSISIYDSSTEKMIWNYDHKYSGGVGSTPSTIVDALMRQCTKKMPYN
jgi:hypothetical protein